MLTFFNLPGAFCGSRQLDEAFEKLVRTLVGVAEYSKLPRNDISDMIQEFEIKVKSTFTISSPQEVYTVNLWKIRDNPRQGIQGATITVSR
jgi:hypothetical protein